MLTQSFNPTPPPPPDKILDPRRGLNFKIPKNEVNVFEYLLLGTTVFKFVK